MAYILGTQKRSWRTMNSADKFFLLLIGAGAFWVFFMLGASMQDFSIQHLCGYLVRFDETGNWQAGTLLQGVFMTLRVSFWCLVLAFASGFFVGIVSAHKRGLTSLPGRLYVLVLRNMPPLILLFLVFFFASSLLTDMLMNIEYSLAKSSWKAWFYFFIVPEGQLDRMAACVLTLGLYEGAYIAEIVRAGIESIPYEQWEAGRAGGLTTWQIRRYIVIPQTLRQSLAPLAGQSISIIKDSAIASVISLQELTFQSMELMNVTGRTVELWILTALLYYCLCLTLEKISQKWERSIQWKPLH